MYTHFLTSCIYWHLNQCMLCAMHFLPCCSDHRSLQLVSVVTMRQAVQREHLCGFIKANHLPLAASHLRHVCWVRLLHVHAAKRHSRMCFFFATLWIWLWHDLACFNWGWGCRVPNHRIRGEAWPKNWKELEVLSTQPASSLQFRVGWVCFFLFCWCCFYL